jgi:hypothetical protein
LPDYSPPIPESGLDGLARESFSARRQRTSTYAKIDSLLSDLRRDRISPVDILIQVLDPDDIGYDRYRGNLYRDDSTKLHELLEEIISDHKGRRKLFDCLRPRLEEFACDIVADEMETCRAKSMLPGIVAVTMEFIEKWNLDEDNDSTPFLTSILTTAAQTEHVKTHNKIRKPEKVHIFSFCFSICAYSSAAVISGDNPTAHLPILQSLLRIPGRFWPFSLVHRLRSTDY